MLAVEIAKALVNKKAIIVIRLVEESAEKSNEEIEKEIMEELSRFSLLLGK